MSNETNAPTDAEVNDMQRREMARQIGQIANRMREVAERLERHSNLLATSDREASAIAADVLNDYTALGTNIAPVVWGIVRELGRTT